MCSYEREGWLGSRDLGFSNLDLSKRAENFAMLHFIPVTGMKSSCFARCIFHIISIPFHNSGTAIRAAKAIIGAKVITLCFALFALFLEFRATTSLRPFVISETGLKFLI